MTDKIQQAWFLAAKYHAGQRYATPEAGVSVPYLAHLGAVTLEVQEAIRRKPDLDSSLATLCAILHDSLEDTDLSPAVLENTFGKAVLDGVRALTKNESLTTKRERMKDSLRRIKAQPREIAVVKLADRICNLAPPPSHWSQDKVSAYRKEAQLILSELGSADDYLANRLGEKIMHYSAR